MPNIANAMQAAQALAQLLQPKQSQYVPTTGAVPPSRPAKGMIAGTNLRSTGNPDADNKMHDMLMRYQAVWSRKYAEAKRANPRRSDREIEAEIGDRPSSITDVRQILNFDIGGDELDRKAAYDAKAMRERFEMNKAERGQEYALQMLMREAQEKHQITMAEKTGAIAEEAAKSERAWKSEEGDKGRELQREEFQLRKEESIAGRKLSERDLSLREKSAQLDEMSRTTQDEMIKQQIAIAQEQLNQLKDKPSSEAEQSKFDREMRYLGMLAQNEDTHIANITQLKKEAVGRPAGAMDEPLEKANAAYEQMKKDIKALFGKKE